MGNSKSKNNRTLSHVINFNVIFRDRNQELNTSTNTTYITIQHPNAQIIHGDGGYDSKYNLTSREIINMFYKNSYIKNKLKNYNATKKSIIALIPVKQVVDSYYFSEKIICGYKYIKLQDIDTIFDYIRQTVRIQRLNLYIFINYNIDNALIELKSIHEIFTVNFNINLNNYILNNNNTFIETFKLSIKCNFSNSLLSIKNMLINSKKLKYLNININNIIIIKESIEIYFDDNQSLFKHLKLNENEINQLIKDKEYNLSIYLVDNQSTNFSFNYIFNIYVNGNIKCEYNFLLKQIQYLSKNKVLPNEILNLIYKFYPINDKPIYFGYVTYNKKNVIVNDFRKTVCMLLANKKIFNEGIPYKFPLKMNQDKHILVKKYDTMEPCNNDKPIVTAMHSREYVIHDFIISII